jgi:hypothetical protein
VASLFERPVRAINVQVATVAKTSDIVPAAFRAGRLFCLDVRVDRGRDQLVGTARAMRRSHGGPGMTRRVGQLDWDHNAYYHMLLLRQLPRTCERCWMSAAALGDSLPSLPTASGMLTQWTGHRR